MNNFDVEQSLKSLAILVDSREQPTKRAERRYSMFSCPWRREKLDFGDYSAECTLPSGERFTLAGKISIERKQNLDELAMCYTRERPRFIREFDRAASVKAKIYLLVENADWEKAYNGSYRSQVKPQSFTASMIAWLARYNCQILMCKEETSGKLIHDILYREMKEHLEGLSDDE